MDRSHFVTILIACCAFFACSPTWRIPPVNGSFDVPGKAYICVDLPDAQIQGVKDAIELWDKSIASWKHLVMVRSGWDSSCSYWIHETTEGRTFDSHALAWASAIGGREITMYKGHYEQDTTGILLHELGHAFGAQHVPGTLMNPTWSKGAFLCPDAITVAQVAAWNKINLDLLVWCYP